MKKDIENTELEASSFAALAQDPNEGVFIIQSQGTSVLSLVLIVPAWIILFFGDYPELIKDCAAVILAVVFFLNLFRIAYRPTATVMNSIVRIAGNIGRLYSSPLDLSVRTYNKFPFRGLSFIADNKPSKQLKIIQFGTGSDLYPSGVWLLASLAARGSEIETLGFSSYQGSFPAGRFSLMGRIWEKVVLGSLVGLLSPIAAYFLLFSTGYSDAKLINLIVVVLLGGLLVALLAALSVLELSGNGLGSIDVEEDRAIIRRGKKQLAVLSFADTRQVCITVDRSGMFSERVSVDVESHYGRRQSVVNKSSALGGGALCFIEAARQSGVTINYMLQLHKDTEPELILSYNDSADFYIDGIGDEDRIPVKNLIDPSSIWTTDDKEEA